MRDIKHFCVYIKHLGNKCVIDSQPQTFITLSHRVCKRDWQHHVILGYIAVINMHCYMLTVNCYLIKRYIISSLWVLVLSTFGNMTVLPTTPSIPPCIVYLCLVKY